MTFALGAVDEWVLSEISVTAHPLICRAAAARTGAVSISA